VEGTAGNQQPQQQQQQQQVVSTGLRSKHGATEVAHAAAPAADSAGGGIGSGGRPQRTRRVPAR
jgi:transcription initiation factor TFIID subunit TAF12